MSFRLNVNAPSAPSRLLLSLLMDPSQSLMMLKKKRIRLIAVTRVPELCGRGSSPTINKGEMDDDEAKEKIAAGVRAFMESSRLFKLTGVRVSPQQSARELRRNLVNLSPEKRFSSSLMWFLQRKVVKVRAELTLEQLGALVIDDSFGSLVRYADTKCFPALF
jgi:hypothetical protein